MNIDKFIESLTEEEKSEILVKLSNEAIAKNQPSLPYSNETKQLTLLKTWLNDNRDKISTRTWNALNANCSIYDDNYNRIGVKYYYLDDDNYKFLELIKPFDLMKIRNFGRQSLDEFIKLRGY